MTAFLWPALQTLLLLWLPEQGGNRIAVDLPEAQKAFTTLNQIRQAPATYCRELQFCDDLPKLKVRRPVLVWNDTLARVAEARATDMATRNYFGHVDPSGNGVNYYIQKSGYRLEPEWTKSRRDNSFESISAGVESGEQVISYLIKDEGIPSLGHRQHLLGLNDWYLKMTDVGIGFVRVRTGGEFSTYVCVITARHHW